MARVTRAGFRFKPFSKKQKQVLTWWFPESGVSEAEGIIADGAIRSGKTVSMGLSFVIWAMETFDGQNFGMCGKTVGSFRRNVLAPLKQMLTSRGYRYRDLRGDNLLEIKRNGKVNYFYIFGGKDERSQDFIQGITLAGVLLDEVALMPRSFVEQACARCSVAGSKFWFNCNPGSPEHWFKKEWIDRRQDLNVLYLHFTMEDNLSLSEKIKKRYRSMYTGVFYDRFIRGKWCIAEGLVYGFFDKDIHVTTELPETGRYYISVDYGTMNPFSAGLWCIRNGVATRMKEFYYNGREETKQMTDEEYADEIEKLAAGYHIQKVIVDPSAASFIATLRRRKFLVKKGLNDVIAGINATAHMLKNGRVRIGAGCADAIREFGLYRWDETSTEDRVIKENDHAMDDIRYFCLTIMAREYNCPEYKSLWVLR